MTAWATVSWTVLPERLLLMIFFLRVLGGLPGPAVQDDRLLLGHLGDRSARPLLADAAALQAAVGHEVGAPERRPVDVDVARVDLPDGPDRACDIRREDPGGEAERGAVGLGDGRLPVLGLAHRDRRPEQLLLAERRRRVDVGDHRRGDDGAVALTTGQDARPGLGDAAIHSSTRSASAVVIRVPIVVSGEDGSPIRIAFTFGTSASRKSLLIAGGAMTRCTEMQTWPALAKPPAATALDARSRSASGIITTGQEAPSSSDSFLTPARAAMRSPIPVEPVKETFRTRGSETSRSPSDPPGPVSTDSTPSGSPASTKHSASARAVSGVVRAGLSTTAFPAASAGAILCSTSSDGC